MNTAERNLYYTWKEFEEDKGLIIKYLKDTETKFEGIYAIPKGGLILGVVLANEFNVPLYFGSETLLKFLMWWNKIRGKKFKMLVVDDISDTGKTLIALPGITELTTITLFIKQGTRFMPSFHCRECERNEWCVFPWESK